jgi:hypothetical protein
VPNGDCLVLTVMKPSESTIVCSRCLHIFSIASSAHAIYAEASVQQSKHSTRIECKLEKFDELAEVTAVMTKAGT